MDVIDIDVRVIFTLFAHIHELLVTYTFDLTDKNVKAYKIIFEVIHLILLSLQAIQILFYFIKIHNLPFCYLLKSTVTLCFSKDLYDAFDLEPVLACFLFLMINHFLNYNL